MSRKEELNIQKAIAEYLHIVHPDILFRSDLGGIRLTRGLRVQAKLLQDGRHGYPDMFLSEPRGQYHGLYGELKTGAGEVFLKDGVTFRKDEHVAEQWAMIQMLRQRGYAADWWLGYDDAIAKIEAYLALEHTVGWHYRVATDAAAALAAVGVGELNKEQRILVKELKKYKALPHHYKMAGILLSVNGLDNALEFVRGLFAKKLTPIDTVAEN